MAVQYDAIDNSIEYRSSDWTFITSQTRLGIWTINAPEVTIIGS
jgi:hypothetical protein